MDIEDGLDGRGHGVSNPTHLVAIGASAGGLDALERFFDGLPADTGAAYVVIQHLSPDHKSMMSTLLARHTAMPVLTVTDGQVLQADVVHLIPPGAILRVEGDKLTLVPKQPRVLSLPIDEFFNSAAQVWGARTIGVVLSGTGTDGTRGAGAIHQAGGLLAAQAPIDAKFDGMPVSVIASGLVDCIRPVDDLGPWVAEIIRLGLSMAERIDERALPEREGGEDEDGDDPYYDILRGLSGSAGINFGDYKPGTIRRRIERRMMLRRITELSEYRDLLEADRAEMNVLRREILVSVTRFFRDPEAFSALVPMIETLLRDAHQRRAPLRLWSAATATGEEAYTLGILALDACHRLGIWPGVKVFATDVDPSNIEIASAGSYPDSISAEVPPEFLERYFEAANGRYLVRSELRQCMVFARHNLLSDAPFTRIDLVSCRNFLIYLRVNAQERALRRLQYALRSDGVLFLGSSETIATVQPEFLAVNAQQRIWRLLRHAPRPVIAETMAAPGQRLLKPRERLMRSEPQAVSAVDQGMAALLRAYAPPPAVLLNAENEIVHSYGDVGQFLALRPGTASLDILKLLPEALVPVATAVLFRAKRSEVESPASHYVPLAATEDQPERFVRLAVLPVLTEGIGPMRLMVFESFSATSSPAAVQTVDIGWETSERLAMLEAELSATRESLRVTIEEMEASSEELQATNEEMMASNEELQSANEELQSVNEELNTVNAEFQEKIEILNRMNADLEHLTRVVPTGTIFLDSDLRLMRFSPDTVKIFRLRDGDVGRPLADLTHVMDYPDLIDEIGNATFTGRSSDREVSTQDGRRYLVRILPYAMPSEPNRSVVLLFVDVTDSKTAMTLRAILDSLIESAVVLDSRGIIRHANARWLRFGAENGADLRLISPGADYLRGWTLPEEGAGEPYRRAARDGIVAVLEGRRDSFSLEYPCDSPTARRWFLLEARALPEGIGGAVVCHLDVSRWHFRREEPARGLEMS